MWQMWAFTMFKDKRKCIAKPFFVFPGVGLSCYMCVWDKRIIVTYTEHGGIIYRITVHISAALHKISEREAQRKWLHCHLLPSLSPALSFSLSLVLSCSLSCSLACSLSLCFDSSLFWTVSSAQLGDSQCHSLTLH